MAITFFPKAGYVLLCDFYGYVAPEMVKRRPVVVISPNHLHRPGLVTVVPLSTTVPDPICDYHYEMKGNPVPGSSKPGTWAKCDMVAVVSVERLDRFKIERGRFESGHVSMDQVRLIRRGVVLSLGFDASLLPG
jgi:uncharacterized protein YifN (PemK superfamily)